MDILIKALPAFGVLGLLFVFVKSAWVNKQDQGTVTKRKKTKERPGKERKARK